MSFSKSTTDIKVHEKLGDYPNVDDGLSADELKKRFDSPAVQIQNDLNNLISELENENCANSLGATKLDEQDASDNNILAKLKKIYNEFKTHRDELIKTGAISDNAITTEKISDNAITTSKITDKNITTEKIKDAAITLEKLADEAKKAINISAEKINDNDESENNIQAKLIKLYNDMIAISQGSVADNSVTTQKLQDGSIIEEKISDNAITNNKLADNSVTTNKISNGNVTTEKIKDGSITSVKISSGYGLVPKGLICMWSGSTVPSGWYLCNGSNGTPDLRDRFIVGSGGSYAIGDKGGEASHSLTKEEMAKHSHIVNLSGSASLRTSGIGVQGSTQTVVNTSTDSGSRWNYTTVSISGECDCAESGEGQPHENRPPYYALAFIMKG